MCAHVCRDWGVQSAVCGMIMCMHDMSQRSHATHFKDSDTGFMMFHAKAKVKEAAHVTGPDISFVLLLSVAIHGPRSTTAQDFFVAGTPCQPFSKLNMRRQKEDYHPFRDDPGARPTVEACRHIRDRKPKTFLLEQAMGLVYGCWQNLKGKAAKGLSV